MQKKGRQRMRVLLVSANREEINMPALPMGLGCVAAAVRRDGHAVKFIDLLTAGDFKQELGKTVAEFEPEVIGVSVRNIDDQVMESTHFLLDQAKAVVSLCRRLSKAPIVLGGAGYSIFPQSALRYLGADMGIQGEGEIAFAVLLKQLQAKKDLAKVPGLYLPQSGLQAARRFVNDLDSVALPDPALMGPAAGAGDFWLPFQTRRGCPLNCSYCSTGMIEGHRIRKRSPEAAVRELARWVQAGFKRVYFVDNTFNLPPSYARELCDQMTAAQLGVSWRCILYPGRVDEALVVAMAEAGCSEVSLGFESGNQMLLRDMHKRFGPREIRRAARMLADYGIRRMGFLLLGGPGETRQSVEESLELAESLNLDALKLTVGVRIYPHTDLAAIAVKEGKLAADDDLLFPRFYMVDGLEDWLRKTLRERAKEHPNWFL
jgi:radical SAM superfamily enzyme YgiQ (UPF0313 family)